MTTFDGKQIIIDPYDYDGMIKLMERHEEFKVPWSGKNDDGEHIQISINEDNITVETFQNNGWIRENIYWKNIVSEELYHR